MKLCFICSQFKKENYNRQPWYYFYNMLIHLIEKNIDFFIISDVENAGGINANQYCVDKIKGVFNESREVLDIVDKENPDLILMLIGLTSFLRLKFDFKKPVIGIFTSPIYGFRDICKVGLKEFYTHYNYLLIHLVGAMIPRFIIRKWIFSFKHIIALTNTVKDELYEITRYQNISVISPSINEVFLRGPKNITESVPPNILYFTSPMTLRGSDVLIKAFKKVSSRIPCKLTFLSRFDSPDLASDEKRLKLLLDKVPEQDVLFFSGILSQEGLIDYLTQATIVCLPFKIVISDYPVSIVEAMAQGVPVITTSLSSLPEIIGDRGVLVKPNDVKDLANKILETLNNKELRKKFIENSLSYINNYPSWEKQCQEIIRIIKSMGFEI